MRMRRVPFFYLACCLQTKLVKKKCESETGEKRRNGQMGKMPKLVQKVQHTANKSKKDRRHIDVTSVAIVLRSTTVF